MGVKKEHLTKFSLPHITVTIQLLNDPCCSTVSSYQEVILFPAARNEAILRLSCSVSDKKQTFHFFTRFTFSSNKRLFGCFSFAVEVHKMFKERWGLHNFDKEEYFFC